MFVCQMMLFTAYFCATNLRGKHPHRCHELRARGLDAHRVWMHHMKSITDRTLFTSLCMLRRLHDSLDGLFTRLRDDGILQDARLGCCIPDSVGIFMLPTRFPLLALCSRCRAPSRLWAVPGACTTELLRGAIEDRVCHTCQDHCRRLERLLHDGLHVQARAHVEVLHFF